MLTLEQIKKISFHKAKRDGYQADEVDTFIDDVEAAFETVLKDRKEMKEKIDRLESELLTCRERESSIGAVLLTAQHQADVLVSDAQQRADAMASDTQQRTDAIVSDAQQRADAIVSDARQRADAIVSEARQTAEKTIENAQKEATESVDAIRAEADAQRATSLRLHEEVSAFRARLLKLYREHLTLIDALPTEAPADAVPSESAVEPTVEETVEKAAEPETVEKAAEPEAAEKAAEPEAVEEAAEPETVTEPEAECEVMFEKVEENPAEPEQKEATAAVKNAPTLFTDEDYESMPAREHTLLQFGNEYAQRPDSMRSTSGLFWKKK